MGYRVVVVGATGNVGREILNILDERLFSLDALEALARLLNKYDSTAVETAVGKSTMEI